MMTTMMAEMTNMMTPPSKTTITMTMTASVAKTTTMTVTVTETMTMKMIETKSAFSETTMITTTRTTCILFQDKKNN